MAVVAIISVDFILVHFWVVVAFETAVYVALKKIHNRKQHCTGTGIWQQYNGWSYKANLHTWL